jgi:alpha-galactosidase
MLRMVSRVVLISSVVISLGLPCRVGLAQGLPELRTPKAPPTPRIHGPKLYGAGPGHPFLYRIPCTGLRPVQFSAVGLPPSLTVDGVTGIISGKAPPTAGEYPVTL